MGYIKPKQKFAVVARTGRVWVISAINGDARRLCALHQELEQHLSRGDSLVYMGNYFGPKPYVLETMEELLGFRHYFLRELGRSEDQLIYLRGQHDEIWDKLLQIQFMPNPAHVLAWMVENGVGSALQAYASSAEEARDFLRRTLVEMTHYTLRLRSNMRVYPGHYEFMSLLRRAAYSEDKKLLFVHCGLDPALNLEAQEDSFWWGHRNFISIESGYQSFKHIFAGYNPYVQGCNSYGSVTLLSGGDAHNRDSNLLAACVDSNGQILKLLEA